MSSFWISTVTDFNDFFQAIQHVSKNVTVQLWFWCLLTLKKINFENLKENSELTVVNSIGEIFFQRKAVFGTELIDLSDLSEGVYFLEIKGEESLISKKLVIVK